MVMFKTESLELSIEDVVTIRDILGFGTNAINQIVGALLGLRPDLIISPTRLKFKLADLKDVAILKFALLTIY